MFVIGCPSWIRIEPCASPRNLRFGVFWRRSEPGAKCASLTRTSGGGGRGNALRTAQLRNPCDLEDHPTIFDSLTCTEATASDYKG
jgi:hypothetical protein